MEITNGYGVPINQEYIIEIDNKQFIRYPGVLDNAHKTADHFNGSLKQKNCELLQIPNAQNGNLAIVKVHFVIETSERVIKEAWGLGDASPENTNRMVSKHIIRMAETRANARALRILANIQFTSLEELGDFTEGLEEEPVRKQTKKATETPKEKDNLAPLQDKLRLLYEESKLSLDEFKSILKDELQIRARKIDTMNEADLQKAVSYFENLKKEATKDHKEPKTRESLIEEITKLRKEYPTITSTVLKQEAASIKGTEDSNIGAADLSTEELETLINNLKEKHAN